MIRSVVLDVGETLIKDDREWGAWADWVGVPLNTLSGLVGALTATGRNNAEAFELIRPGFDLAVERQLREEAGVGERIEESDLYPDVRSALTALKNAGYWIGVAGNQTDRAAELLRRLALPVDALATSGEWGVAKPDTRFFQRVTEFAPGEPHEILYVGDHRDNDVVPASMAGLRTALIRRGPYGYLWANDPIVRKNADWVIESLAELPDRLVP
ncbi:HAD family hydrolase [Amycolatopsis speibonae]|uniref:HAD family hydrolase n=1 Tax=Amycolatopsis speibonae TaxID=1450224 RepID=A0ABV7P127_9PSEU